jgi:uncharacterized protein (TIGR02284 family)
MAKEPDDKHAPADFQKESNPDQMPDAPGAQPVDLGLGATAGEAVNPAAEAVPWDVAGILNGLLAASHDGVYGFADCAEHTQAPDLRALLLRHAEGCRLAGLELRTQVNKYGGEPDVGGTASGALHRGWIALRGTVSGFTDLQMLQECERAQDAILASYREALQLPLPAELALVLQELQRHAQGSYDQLKAAREAFAAAP